MKICRLHRGTTLPLFVLTLGLLVGCEEDEDYTVNSDGTGKILISVPRKLDLRMMVHYSKGVDAWSDLQITRGEDGKIVSSSIIAYIPDVTAFNLNGAGSLPAFTRNEDGSLQVETRFDIPEGEKIEGAELERVMEEFGAMIAAQSKFLGSRMKGTGDSSIAIRCAGEPEFSPHFIKTDDGAYQITNNTPRNLAVMKAIVEDKVQFREIASHGKQGTQEAFRAAVAKEVYGTADPLRFVVPAGGAPLFDYAAEVKAAKDGAVEMLSKSGYFRTVLPEEPADLPLTLVLAGHRFTHSNLGSPMIDIRLSGQLAEDVVHIGKIELVEVLDAEGEVLFPALDALAEFDGRMADGKLASRITLPAIEGTFKRIAMVIPVGKASESEITSPGEGDLPKPIEGAGFRLDSSITKLGGEVVTDLEWSMQATAPFTIIRVMGKDGDEIITKRLVGTGPHKGSHGFHGKEILWAKVEIESFPDYVQLEVPVVLVNVPAQE